MSDLWASLLRSLDYLNANPGRWIKIQAPFFYVVNQKTQTVSHLWKANRDTPIETLGEYPLVPIHEFIQFQERMERSHDREGHRSEGRDPVD